MLKAHKCKPKMLRISKYYHFVLIETMKSVKNEQNMHKYQIITEQTDW